MTKDVLAAFSPATDFLAVATADGRIKTWDVGNGHLRGEFVDVTASTSGAGTLAGQGNGHLAVDYTCIAWASLSATIKKGKKKGTKDAQPLLLVLGTGAGDVLAWDASLGQLKWRTDDCNAGGVKALAISKCGKILYTSGADGMVCELDSGSGRLLEKFRAAKTAVSCIAVSPDGGTLLTASSELKLFDLSSKKRMRKFAGHPTIVTALTFSGDGKYVLSSATGERQVAVWSCEGSKSDTGAVFSLSSDQPAVSLNCNSFKQEAGILRVLALTEAGVAYVWQGTSIEELASVKPMTLSVSTSKGPRPSKGFKACLLAAQLVKGSSDDPNEVLVAHGNTAKIVFEQVPIDSLGTSIVFGSDSSGALLPTSQPAESTQITKPHVTIIGADNAADAVVAKPHVEGEDINLSSKKMKKKRRASADLDGDAESMQTLQHARSDSEAVTMNGEEEDELTMEERLVALGIIDKDLSNEEKGDTVAVVPPQADSLQVLLSQALQADDAMLLERCLAVMDEKVIMNTVRKLRPAEAGKLLSVCMVRLETRPRRGLALVPWLRIVLLQHAASIMSNPAMQPVLTTLYQLIEARLSVFRPLLALSGRLDLIMAQISANEAGVIDDSDAAVVYEEEDSEPEVEEVMEDESSEDISEKEASDDGEAMDTDREEDEGSP